MYNQSIHTSPADVEHDFLEGRPAPRTRRRRRSEASMLLLLPPIRNLVALSLIFLLSLLPETVNADLYRQSSVPLQLVALPISQPTPEDAIPVDQSHIHEILGGATIHKGEDGWFIFIPPLRAEPDDEKKDDDRHRVFIENLPHPHDKTNNLQQNTTTGTNENSQANGQQRRIRQIQENLNKYSPLQDQIIIIFTMVGMTFLVSFIHFQHPGRWKNESAMRNQAHPAPKEIFAARASKCFPSFKTTDQYTASPVPSDEGGQSILGEFLFKRPHRHKKRNNDLIDVSSTVTGSNAFSSIGLDNFSAVSSYGPSLAYSRSNGLAWNDSIDQFDV